MSDEPNALERYFSDTKSNALALARKIGCAPSSITRPLKGQRNASMDLALLVEKADIWLLLSGILAEQRPQIEAELKKLK